MEEEEQVGLLALPPELQWMVLTRVEAADIRCVACTCTALRSVLCGMEDEFWRKCEDDYGLFFLPESYREARRRGRRIGGDVKFSIKEPLWQERPWRETTLSRGWEVLAWLQENAESPVRELTEDELRAAEERWPDLRHENAGDPRPLHADEEKRVAAYRHFYSVVDVEKAVSLPALPFFLVRPLAFCGNNCLISHDINDSGFGDNCEWLTLSEFLENIEKECEQAHPGDPELIARYADANCVEFLLWAGEALYNLLEGCERRHLPIPYFNLNEIVCDVQGRFAKFHRIGFFRGCGHDRCTCKVFRNLDCLPQRLRLWDLREEGGTRYFTAAEALWSLGEFLRNGLLDDGGLFYRIHPMRSFYYYGTGRRFSVKADPPPTGALLDPTIVRVIGNLSRGMKDNTMATNDALVILQGALSELCQWLLERQDLLAFQAATTPPEGDQ